MKLFSSRVIENAIYYLAPLVKNTLKSICDFLTIYIDRLHYNVTHPTYDVREFPPLTMNFP